MGPLTLRLTLLLAVLAAAVAIGWWRRQQDGRLRDPGRAAGESPALTAAELGRPLGGRATLLQFSSEFCAPCRATHRLLAGVAATLPGVTHVELDAAEHLELVRRFDVRRTPTVFVLDGAGHPAHRFAGIPRAEELTAALATHA